MRTWWFGEIRSSDVPIGDRYVTDSHVMYEHYVDREGVTRWKVLAHHPVDFPLDEWDIALLRHSFGLSEDVKL